MSLKKLPSSQEIKDIINYLSNIDPSDLPKEKLKYWLDKILMPAPIIRHNLKKGDSVQRARINIGKTLFSKKSDVSYRTDLENIHKYGRANDQHKSMFYCANSSSKIEIPRLILLNEVDEMLRAGDKELSSNYLMTISKWDVNEDIILADVLFSEHAASSLPEVQEAKLQMEEQIKEKFADRFEDVELILKFIGDRFSKKDIKNHQEYKISSYYSHFVLEKAACDGIMYSSVRAEMLGRNLALSPKAVDNKLKLTALGVINVRKEKNHLILDNYAQCADFAKNDSEFKWELLEMTPEWKIQDMFQQKLSNK